VLCEGLCWAALHLSCYYRGEGFRGPQLPIHLIEDHHIILGFKLEEDDPQCGVEMSMSGGEGIGLLQVRVLSRADPADLNGRPG